MAREREHHPTGRGHPSDKDARQNKELEFISDPLRSEKALDKGGAASARPSPAVIQNIDEIVRIEQRASTERSHSERLSDSIAAFAGTWRFIFCHLVVIALWIAWNSALLPSLPKVDPFPFSLLNGIISLEGVLLATFVLIKQNRMGARADERSHLSLQVSMLAEQEITKVIQMLERMSHRLNIGEHVTDDETAELGRNTAVGALVDHLRERLPGADG